MIVQGKEIRSSWRMTKPFLIMIGTLFCLITLMLVFLEDEQSEIFSLRKAPKTTTTTTATGNWWIKTSSTSTNENDTNGSSTNDTSLDEGFAPQTSTSTLKQADVKNDVEASITGSTNNASHGPEVTLQLVSNETSEGSDSIGNVIPGTDKKGNVTAVQPLIPSWSKLPPSHFTAHVLDILSDYNVTNVYACSPHYNLTVAVPDTIPTVACDGQPQNELFCITLRRIFAARPLPYNVSVGFQLSDYTSAHVLDMKSCLGSSAVDGKFCIPNMEDIGEMNFREPNHDHPELFKWQYDDTIPWKDRNPVPIFRGQLCVGSGEVLCQDSNFTYELAKDMFPMRLKAVDFSVDHPDLLDAKFSQTRESFSECLKQNATNGFSKLLHWSYIPNNEYFANYQAVLVLGGYGAAYRTSRHFMTRTAVLLEDFEYKEWFTPYLEPFVHYVPLSKNLDNLKETLLWVRDHPEDLERIAEHGRAFYDKYLTFHHNEEHIYELVYRLAEYAHHVEHLG